VRLLGVASVEIERVAASMLLMRWLHAHLVIVWASETTTWLVRLLLLLLWVLLRTEIAVVAISI